MKNILLLIPLLLVLVPLSGARVNAKQFTITCVKALKALERKHIFPRSPQTHGKFFWSSTPTFSCFNEGHPLSKSDNSVAYRLRDPMMFQYELRLNWGSHTETKEMIANRNWASGYKALPDDSGILKMYEFAEIKVDNDGNLVGDHGTPVNGPTRVVQLALLEYWPYGTLQRLLETFPEFAEHVFWFCQTLFQIAQGVAKIHESDKIHNDIALDTVVMNAKNEPKLSISKTLIKKGSSATSNSLEGRNICTAPPEILGLGLGLKDEDRFVWSDHQDTYSIGVLSYQMANKNKFPFDCDQLLTPNTPGSAPVVSSSSSIDARRQMYYRIEEGEFTVPSKTPFWLIRLFYWCFQYEKEKRWSDQQILDALTSVLDSFAKPKVPSSPLDKTKLTAKTPIIIPGHIWPKYIRISTNKPLKELEDFEKQSIEVLNDFNPDFPAFLYTTPEVPQLKLVL